AEANLATSAKIATSTINRFISLVPKRAKGQGPGTLRGGEALSSKIPHALYVSLGCVFTGRCLPGDPKRRRAGRAWRRSRASHWLPGDGRRARAGRHTKSLPAAIIGPFARSVGARPLGPCTILE